MSKFSQLFPQIVTENNSFVAIYTKTTVLKNKEDLLYQ